MFSSTVIFSLFVGCFGINVYIKDPPPVEFTVNKPRIMTCAAENVKPPITFQWSVIQAGSNYTFPNSNHSQLAITFFVPQTGYIVCQAKGRQENRFYNSTKVSFYAKSSGSRDKQVWISNSSPINFKVNHVKTLTCKTKGFTYPISYQWIDVRNAKVLATSDFPDTKFVFKNKVKDGLIQCRVRDRGDAYYTPSKYVPYQVNPDVLVWIDTPSSPIIFRVNRTKSLTCKTVDTMKPISYQWVNVSTGTIFGVFTTPSVKLTFPQRIKNGQIQCLAQDSGQTFYTPSSPVEYRVNGQMSHKINTFFLSVMTMFAFTFSTFQKIH